MNTNKQFYFFKLSWLRGAEKKARYSFNRRFDSGKTNRWLFKQHHF